MREDLLEEVRSLARRGRITLLFGARDETQNNAVALREVLLKEQLAAHEVRGDEGDGQGAS